MNKIIYISVEQDFEKAPLDLYKSSRQIMRQLDKEVELFLVFPGDYEISTGLIKAAYKYVNSNKIKQVKGIHEPFGDMFIIYGDETSKNLGLNFAKNQYKFLKKLKTNKQFSHFYNEPEVEEATLKDKLVSLSKDKTLGIAETYFYKSKNQVEELLDKYSGSLIVKPIFGCRMAGVQKITSVDDLAKAGLTDSELRENYIFQQPLKSQDEKRIFVLDGKILGSRIYYNRKNPWNNSKNQITKIENPSDREAQISMNIAKKLGSYLLGVDFIGEGVNEINGTGTGVVFYDKNNKLIFDKTPQVVESILSKL